MRWRLDNTSVMPYNPYLTRKYPCHINVEVCSSIVSAKYLYKYVYKGHDRARIRIQQNGNEQEHAIHDEIKAHLDARYVCAPEAAQQGQQTVPFIAGQEAQAIAADENTKLTAWFHLNEEYASREHQGTSSAPELDPRQFYYCQFPEHFTWDKHRKKWLPRKNRCRVLGRIRVNNHIYDTYADAVRFARYMDDDSYESPLEEATAFRMPSELRSFFASLLCFCELSNPRNLWNRFKSDLSEDYRNHGISPELAESLAFHDIGAKTALHSVVLKGILNVNYSEIPSSSISIDYAEHVRIGETNYAKLNGEQRKVVDDENMRVSTSEFEWKQYLLELGNGMLPVDENDEMAVPPDFLCTGSLVHEIFSPYLSGRCSGLSNVVIPTPKNEDSLRIKNNILERMPGEDIVYSSIDSAVVEDPSDMLNMPTEFLNKMTPSGFPPHDLHIKKDVL
ncbi:hypothetical protein OESDEN_12645 [Oesophagostomum dentatum]|uniref:Uncharacterized protein n=1 Tax=Oesophagostomum dentatum TaxID=61180 RepID=A0A0B1SRL2_OESDE|nr:hypothetical protein OESDEN_12645 [Oesophagostomum dentatum]